MSSPRVETGRPYPWASVHGRGREFIANTSGNRVFPELLHPVRAARDLRDHGRERGLRHADGPHPGPAETKLIGSGPFKVTSYDPSTGDVATEKNSTYWRAGFPYLDHLNFKVSEGTDNRLNGLQGKQFDIMLDSSGATFDTVKSLPGITYQRQPAGRREIGMVLLNVSRPPLNDMSIRKAIAQGTDRNALNEIAHKDNFTLTDQVVDQAIMGYLPNPGFPKYDPKAAKQAVDTWKRAHGGKTPTFNLQSPADEMNKALAQDIKRQMAAIGVTVNLPAPVDQATIISQAVGSAVDSFIWRNYTGGDPDTLYPWFKSGSIVNFNKIRRASPRPAAQAAGRT